MFPDICSMTVKYQASIVPHDDMPNYYMSNEAISKDTNLSNNLTPDEYECFKTLLMKVVKMRNVKIEGNHTIEIIHKVDYRN